MTKDDERKMLNECIKFNRCDKIVAQYWNLVCSAVRKTFSLKHAPLVREDLEEVYQEVFFQLLDDNRRRLRLYKEGKNHSLARWIVVITNHTTLNYLRKKGFDSPMWRDKKVVLEDSGYESSDHIESKLLERLSLDSALQTISQADRIVFKLHRFGMPSRDIANIIDSTEASVNNRISKIRKVLSEFLQNEG